MVNLPAALIVLSLMLVVSHWLRNSAVTERWVSFLLTMFALYVFFFWT